MCYLQLLTTSVQGDNTHTSPSWVDTFSLGLNALWMQLITPGL